MKYPDYCGKHQTEAWKKSLELKQKKACSEYLRRCREELDLNYKFSQCDKCREKDRLK